MREQSSNQHIIWLHGWGSTNRVWTSFLSSMPDVRHYPLDVASWFRCAEGDLEQVIAEALRLIRIHLDLVRHLHGKVMLAGWSLGSLLMMQVLKRLEKWELQQIEGVIVLNGTLAFCGASPHQGWPKRVVQRMQRQLHIPDDSALQTLEAFLVQADVVTRVGSQVNLVEDANDVLREWGVGGLINGLQALIEWNMQDWWQSLASDQPDRRMPHAWLWLHGGDDPICPIGAMEHALSLSQHAQRTGFIHAECVPDAGHTLFLQKSDVIATVIRNWLRGLTNGK